MKSLLYVCFGVLSMALISCSKPVPPVDADLTGYELTPVSGSEFYIATKSTDGVKIQEGYVMNGRKNGIWIDYSSDGKISVIQHFVQGNLSGPHLNLDNRGQLTSRMDYKNGVYDGIVGTYKFGRPLEEIPYVNGKITGVMKKYYDNTKLMEEAEYKDNLQDGYYRHYNAEGTMDLEYFYKNGEKVSGGIVNPD